MSVENNKQHVKNFIEVIWNQGEADRLADFVTSTYREHAPLGVTLDLDEYRQELDMYRTAYPDMHFDVTNILGEQDLVACSFVVTGTNDGPLGSLEPTGNSIKVEGCVVVRIEDGKMAEAWRQHDLKGSLIQLGVESMPEPWSHPATGEHAEGEGTYV